ncbi:hypothetical protein [Sphingomonas quercus]|uniref:Uncharacterized protein n=1 Tax=Sphingomonas quercus TaxID=2842451 RepID=A0ABS6BH85_9SPHN|nr:hypothetical protein [Sphingomonas quercus]MBU3077663.1 hypothetical protein [Sphingomonas quercus]
MPNAHDKLIAKVTCPDCGAVLKVSYRQIRLYKAAGCSCGFLIRINESAPISEVQRLLDKGSPLSGANDG